MTVVEHHKQRGVALIMALLVVALATIVAVNMMVRADTEFRRAESQLHGEQAMQYVLGAEQWVAQILHRDLNDSIRDHRGEDWATELPPLPVEGGFVRGRLEDLQGRFNLTNLVSEDGTVDEHHAAQLSRLLQVLGVDGQLAVAAIVDFIDPDMEPSHPDGVEDGQYLGLNPPYRTPNRPLMTAGELMLLRDFDASLLPVLAGHLASLPRRTALNVNTATPEVLASLADGMSVLELEVVVQDAADAGFGSLEEFRRLIGINPDPALSLGLSTDWFLLTVEVAIGTTNLTMYSLLERLPDGRVRVVARRRTPL